MAATLVTSRTQELEREIFSRRWFYRFTLPGGRETPCALPPDVEPIHETRRRMVFSVLDQYLAGRWHDAEALDVGCHQGWYSQHLAARGCRRVLGIDVRSRNIEDAKLMAKALGHANVSFRTGNVIRLDPSELGKFDVVLVLGLLYHLENPIEALRAAHAVTRGVCLIETQVIPNVAGVTDWGTARVTKYFPGCFGVIDETSDVESGNQEANVSTLSLVPSLQALLFVLRSLGFSRVEVLPPPEGAYEQFARGRRVLVAAFVDPA